MAGQAHARAKGKHVGRPRRETAPTAVQAAGERMHRGWSLRWAAKATGIPRDTLRRRLAEFGPRRTG